MEHEICCKKFYSITINKYENGLKEVRKLLKIAIIGRTEILYNSALLLRQADFEIVSILTAKEEPEYKIVPSDFEELAKNWNIPFEQGSKITQHEDFLRACAADIAVSMNYTGIIPQSIIDIFPLGILNIHGGDLPRYRGNACQAWAILNGESKIALCVHRMIGGELDSGDIVARDYLAIDHTTKVTAVWNWYTERAPELMFEAIKQLILDPSYVMIRQSKNPQDVLRCYPRRPEDGRINWNSSALEVLRLINASNKPYAGAFCEYKGKKLIIWDAELVEDGELYCAIPGQVTKICQNGSVEIATLGGKLRLLDVELDKICSKPSPSFIRSLRDRLS